MRMASLERGRGEDGRGWVKGNRGSNDLGQIETSEISLPTNLVKRVVKRSRRAAPAGGSTNTGMGMTIRVRAVSMMARRAAA